MIENLQGTFSLIFVIISVIIGFKILIRYYEYKKIQFFYVGVGWIGLSIPWIIDTISFLLIFYFDFSLDEKVNIILTLVFIPFFLYFWTIAFTELMYKHLQKFFLIVVLIVGIIFEIIFWYFVFDDFTQIGKLEGPSQVILGPYILTFVLFFIVYFLISGITFSIKAIKSDQVEIKFKGIFLLIAFTSFTIGIILEEIISFDPIWVVLTRLILISSAIEFYFGFILPDWLKVILIKEQRMKFKLS